MRLKELTSKNPKFRSLIFAPGLNIILGKRISNSQQDTYNSVGKSLSHELVHFLFCGSLPKPLTDTLSNYDFDLLFSHNSIEHHTNRSMKSPKSVVLDNHKMDIDAANRYLLDLFIRDHLDKFGDIDRITFRGLFSRFARSILDEAYLKAIYQITNKEDAIINNIYNSALLGLDTYLIEEKEKANKLKEEIRLTKDHLSKIQHEMNDPSLVFDIEDKIKSLEMGLRDFLIADNLTQLREQSDTLTNDISTLRNELFVNKRKVKNKKSALKDEPNVHYETIEKLYVEANYIFPESVKVSLSKAHEFHIKLLESRKNRLLKEVHELEKRNSEILKKITALDIELSGIMCFIANAGALEERDAMRDELEILRKKRDDLKKYDSLLNSLKIKISNLNQELERIKSSAILYLSTNTKHIDVLQKSFRDITRRFYNEHPGILEISVPERFLSNKQVFDINPQIEGDGGGGINQVKIFCYDLLISRINKGLFDFMMHDSRLFSEMDERQRALCFELIAEECANSGLQYVCSLNHDIFESVLENTQDPNLKRLLENSVILELSDESVSKKLFGIQFDYRRK